MIIIWNCVICNRPLKTAESRKRGMGPTCAGRNKTTQMKLPLDPKDQLFNDKVLELEQKEKEHEQIS